jgi:hypothetical protein
MKQTFFAILYLPVAGLKPLTLGLQGECFLSFPGLGSEPGIFYLIFIDVTHFTAELQQLSMRRVFNQGNITEGEGSVQLTSLY